MNIIRLILKEIAHRKMNFLLGALAAAAAVTLFTAFFTSSQASQRETIRLMRDMGYNLRIIHKNADMSEYWSKGYTDLTLPQETAELFTKEKDLMFTHILATLKKPVEWNGKRIILVGISTEVSPEGKKKPSMIFSIKPGTAYAGYTLAQEMGVSRGDTIELGGKPLKIENTLQEEGSESDIFLYVDLSDAQAILNLPGQVNEIKALDCYCQIPGVDPLDMMRQQVAAAYPDVKLFQISSIAKARMDQRHMLEMYFAWIMPIIAVACGVWIAAMVMINARERREEIGVLRALGYGSGKIAGLFLGKAILIGLIGACAGFALGTIMALRIGPAMFPETAKSIQTDWATLRWALILTPAFAAVSSFIPTMLAVSQDPAETLRPE